MTVASQLNRKDYSGDGTTVAFATSPVIFFDATDLEVYHVSSAGVATLKTINTDYTVSGGLGATGTVTTLFTASASESIIILRSVALTQSTDFVNNDVSDAEVAETAFDRLTMIVQQLQEQIDRSIKVSVTNLVDPDALVASLESDAASAAANASLAVTSAAAASASATSAAASDADAQTQSGLASTQATAAAAESALASVQATAAAAQAALASIQATNASADASTATTQAGLASTQATAAAASAAAASTSETNAAASYDSFDDRYLGPKTSDPTLDNDGNALLNGALYFNTSTNLMMVYRTASSTWATVSIPTVTVSTAAATGGSDGDIWFQRAV